MGRKRCLQFYIVCQIIILPLYLGFLFNCPTQSFARVNDLTSYAGLQLETACNQACQCNVNPALSDPAAVTSPFYEPVCHLPSTTTYFSACLAGCTSSTALTNRTVFHNCACLPANGPDDYVIPGACPSDCNHIYFSILLFLNILFTFVATMPGLVASLRSVEHVQRSLSLGLQTILLRGLGTVPGPVVFGIIIDQTCLLWQTTVGQQDCGDGNESVETSKGSCRLYDNVPMSENVMAVILAWRFVGAIFFVLALYFSKTSPVKDEIHTAEEGKEKIES